MSGASLFPDDYPNEPDPAKEHRTCCETLVAPEGVDALTWRLVHSFAHTRSAVGANSLAGLAGCRPRVALQALTEAEQAGWLMLVVPEPFMKNPPPLWLGRLSQRS